MQGELLQGVSEKYKNLILYLLERANDVNLGIKKLFKLLYFIDFDYYERHEESITGETYIVQQYGPIPASGYKVLDAMKRSNWIAPVKVKVIDYEQNRFIPQRKADLSVFSGDELEHIEAVVRRFEHYDGAKIEAVAKSDIPYQATKASRGSDIDYELVFYRAPSSVLLGEENDAAILKSKPLAAYLEKLAHR